MRKQVIAFLAIALAAIIISLGVNSGISNASPIVPTRPNGHQTHRVYCFNEPIRRHGRTINRIECVSMASRGTLG